MRETFHYAAAESWEGGDRYTCFIVLFPVYLRRINLLKIMSVVRSANSSVLGLLGMAGGEL